MKKHRPPHGSSYADDGVQDDNLDKQDMEESDDNVDEDDVVDGENVEDDDDEDDEEDTSDEDVDDEDEDVGNHKIDEYCRVKGNRKSIVFPINKLNHYHPAMQYKSGMFQSLPGKKVYPQKKMKKSNASTNNEKIGRAIRRKCIGKKKIYL